MMMALDPGSPDATSGLSKGIFDALAGPLRPQLQQALANAAPDRARQAMSEAEQSWKTLSFAIASAVVAHLLPGPPDDYWAETFSSAHQDDSFWAWHADLATAMSAWVENDSAGIAELKDALKAFFQKHPTSPVSLQGVLR